MIQKEFDVGSRLRSVRTSVGLSQRQLAERADVPHGQISMIEGNRSSPSVSSLRKILSGIPMTMAEFFKTEILAHPQEQVVFRPNELLDLTSQFPQSGDGGPEAHLSLRQVGDAHRHNLRILYEVYSPGADTGETMLEHESSEGGVVVSGELELTVGGAVYLLRTGDSFLFDSRRPHRFRNVSQFPTTVVSACAPPYL